MERKLTNKDPHDDVEAPWIDKTKVKNEEQAADDFETRPNRAEGVWIGQINWAESLAFFDQEQRFLDQKARLHGRFATSGPLDSDG